MPLRTRQRFVLVALGSAVLILSATLPALRLPRQYWHCGHQVHFRDRLASFMSAGHRHCGSSSLVNELRNCALAERIFITDQGRPSTNLAELQADGALSFTPRHLASMSYRLEGTFWSISVAKAPQFAGYYLATPTGLFFHADRWPTTNDMNLDEIHAFQPRR